MIFFDPGGCVICCPERVHDFFCPERLRDFFCLERLRDFFLSGDCMIFFCFERLHDFFPRDFP